MNIIVKESTLVSPAEETPKGNLWLSRLDMIIRQPFSHSHFLCTYPYPIATQTFSPPRSSSTFFDVNILKSALSRVLVPYYPFAGRLKMNENDGRYEIECNAKGALFVYAETSTHSLVDIKEECFKFGDGKLQKALSASCNYAKGDLSVVPLVMVQLTRFKCGGVSLGLSSHHHATDGASYLQFVKVFAELARGLNHLATFAPCHDRATYLAPRYPPQVHFRHLEYEPPLPPLPPKGPSGEVDSTTVECFFKLSEDQVKNLKLNTNPDQQAPNYKLSTVNIIAAHVWRTVSKARGVAEEQQVKLYMHTDGRKRLKNPSIPQNYCGNVIFFTSCVATAGELVANPLWYTAHKIHKALHKMNDVEYLKSAIDYAESKPLTSLVRGPHCVTCPNMQVNSLYGMPFSQVLDFGWSGPKFTSIGGIKSEGQSTIFQSLDEDGGVYVAIRLFTPHMLLFQKYFYTLLPIPSPRL